MKKFKSLKDPSLIRLIKEGSIGILPTDTVYGLVCSAFNPDSLSRVNGLKGREIRKGVVIAANIDQLVSIGLKKRYLKAVEEYWPGPVSVVIPCSNVVNNLDLGTHYMGVRIPDHQELLKLLDETGPLVTSSANMTGETPVNNIELAESAFGDKLDFYVDGGDYSNKEPSALIQIVDDAVEVIRPGYGFN